MFYKNRTFYIFPRLAILKILMFCALNHNSQVGPHFVEAVKPEVHG